MATKWKVKPGSVHCRDCGGRTQVLLMNDGTRETWCKNATPTQCRNMSAGERRFCERCGHPSPGRRPCVGCGEEPL